MFLAWVAPTFSAQPTKVCAAMTVDQSSLQNGATTLSLVLNGEDEEASKLLKVNGLEVEDGEAGESVAEPGACVECEGACSTHSKEGATVNFGRLTRKFYRSTRSDTLYFL